MSIAQDFDRIPPHDDDAEKAVLGSMMMTKDAIADVSMEIRGEDYYKPAHETIHNSILDLYGRGDPADALTVANYLQQQGELDRVGGPAYIHTLIQSVPTAANADYYARIVKEHAQMRSLVEAGTRIAQLGYAVDGAEPEEVINQAQQEIYAVTSRDHSEDYKVIGDLVDETLHQLEVIQKNDTEGSLSVPTGFTELDDITNGLHPGQMIIVAARPAMGKSTIALDMCRNASIKHKLASIIFSLEMSRSEIVMRMLSAEASVPLGKMRSGKMGDPDWMSIARNASKLSEVPLFIDDSPNMSMTEIRSKCRRLKQQKDLRLVVVDYLQLMTSGKRVESRQQEVSEFSRALKLLAKELEIPVIAVAQLNRGPEARSDHKPMLSDLRESGSLEQDADVVLLLNRPSAYDENDRPGEADVIIAKHRNGPTGTVSLSFLGHYARFGNMAHE